MSEIQKEGKLLMALRKQYQGSLIYRYKGFFIVKERNLDTKKYEFHLFGISMWHGFVCTFPSQRATISFVDEAVRGGN